MFNKKIVLIGGGGHCYSVADSLLRIGVYSEIVITDEKEPVGKDILGCKVVGNDDVLEELYGKGFTFAFITVGGVKSNQLRRIIKCNAERIGYEFPSIVDPSAVVSNSVRIGRGAFIGKNVVINADAVIGDFSIINTGAIIEHRCKIGSFTHIAIGADICGDTEIGERSFIGANSTVIQCLDVGADVVVGAGSVVLNSIPDGRFVTGVWNE